MQLNFGEDMCPSEVMVGHERVHGNDSMLFDSIGLYTINSRDSDASTDDGSAIQQKHAIHTHT